MGSFIDLFKEAFNEWNEDNCLQLGAALAYYALFSLFPLLLIIITIIGRVYGDQQEQVVSIVSSTTSASIGDLVGQTLEGMQKNQAAGGISAIIGFILLLSSASGVFGQLDSTFNIIWNVKKPELQGGIVQKIIAALKDKSLAFTMVMGTVFLLLISLVISSFITAIGGYLNTFLPGGEFIFQVVQTLVSIALVAVAFAAIFKELPDTDVEWSDVWVGALLTSVLFTMLKQLLSWYIGNSGSFSAYGIVGAVLALLTWIYFTSQILFFGGEFTQVYARRFGSHVAKAETNTKLEVNPAALTKLSNATASPATRAGIQRQEELSKQRYAFAAGGVIAGVIGTLLAAIVGAIVGVVRGVAGLRRRS